MVKGEIRKKEKDYRFIFETNPGELFDILYIYTFENFKSLNLKTLREPC